MQITQEQLDQAKEGQPVQVSGDGEQFVLIRQDVYDKVKRILYDDGELTEEEATQVAWEAGCAIGWETPEMAEYDDYDRHRNAT